MPINRCDFRLRQRWFRNRPPICRQGLHCLPLQKTRVTPSWYFTFPFVSCLCMWRWLTPLRFGWRSPRLSRLLATSSTLAKTAPSRSLPFTGSPATYTVFLSSWTLSCWNSTNRRSNGLNMITNPELYNYLDIMSESPFHYQVQAGLRKYLEASLGKLHANTKDPAIRNQIRLVKEQGTTRIKVDRKLLKQADISFGPVGSLPALACEVS